MSYPKVEGYVITRKLGSGSYSTVYKAFKKVGPRQTVAIKCVDQRHIRATNAVDSLLTEIKLLKTFSHPHIVIMHDFLWDTRNINIIMEYCSEGDLGQYIHKVGRIPEDKALYFMQQLVSAIQYMHKQKVTHRDLKPQNLLLHKGEFQTPSLKVADFGFAQYLDASETPLPRGSPLYMAPEMFICEYDHRADLWSVGVIFYEMLFGFAPYKSETIDELMQKVYLQAPITLPPNPRLSPGCESLVLRLLRHNVDDRITHEELFKDRYLNLKHMPTKESIIEGTLLLNKGVEAEQKSPYYTKKNTEIAIKYYMDGLDMLIPCLPCFTDLNKKMLTTKLALYLKRVEDLKIGLDHKCIRNDDTSESDSEEMDPNQVYCYGHHEELTHGTQELVPAAIVIKEVIPSFKIYDTCRVV